MGVKRSQDFGHIFLYIVPKKVTQTHGVCVRKFHPITERIEGHSLATLARGPNQESRVPFKPHRV